MNIKEGKMIKGGRNDPPTTERPAPPEGQQPQYPECEKMTSVRGSADIVGEFLDWLSNKKEYSICGFYSEEPDEGEYHPIDLNIEQLLAEFFEIDLNKVEEEKRQILGDIRRKDENNDRKMKITTKFDVGNIVQHKFNKNKTFNPEDELEKIFILKFQILEIITNSCYAGTQVSYKCRALVEYKYMKEAKAENLPIYTEPEIELVK